MEHGARRARREVERDEGQRTAGRLQLAARRQRSEVGRD